MSNDIARNENESGQNPLLELAPDKQEAFITACNWVDQNVDYEDDDNVSRRGVLQGIVTLLTGAAVGGGAYALSTEEVEAAVAAVGQVGEPGSPVDVYGSSVHAEDAAVTPSDASAAAGTNISKKIAAILRTTNDGHALTLQADDDSVKNGPGKADIHWYSAAGERLFAMVAYPFDNEFSVYGKADAVGSGDTSLLKRMDIENGADNARVFFRNSDRVVVRPEPNNPPTRTRMIVDNTGTDAISDVVLSEGGTEKWMLRHWPGDDESVRIRYSPNTEDIAKLLPGGDIELLKVGAGVTVTSPDGTVTKTFGVRNDGTWGELP